MLKVKRYLGGLPVWSEFQMSAWS